MTGCRIYLWFMTYCLLVLPRQEALAEVVGRVLAYPSQIEFEQFPCSLRALAGESYLAGDFTGDGCTDLLIFESSSFRIWMQQGNCDFTFSERKLAIEKATKIQSKVAVQLNSDSCMDLLILTETQLITYLSDCKGSLQQHGNAISVPAGHRNLSAGVFPTKGILAAVATATNPNDGWFVVLNPPEHPLFHNVQYPHRLPANAQLFQADGLGELELLFFEPELGEFFAQPARGAPIESESIWRASFPRNAWQEFYTGDFSGDGREDILALGSGLSGWWIATSVGETSLESSLQMPLPLIASGLSVRLVSDANGDGFSELLDIPLSEGGRCFFFQEKMGAPVSGARVFGSDGSMTSSDGEGRYSLSSAPTSLSVEAFGFYNTWIKSFDEQGTTGKRIVNILVSPNETKEPRRGQQIDFSGVKKGPTVCIGYHPFAPANSPKWGTSPTRCGRGEAFIAVDDQSPGKRSRGKRFFQGVCCPLPADDILLEETVEAEWECPKNYVAVGSRFTEKCDSCDEMLLCSPINPKKYHLSERLPGILYGEGVSAGFGGRYYSLSQLPPAIRTGLSRLSFNVWQRDGCIGSTPGSLYIGSAREGDCDAHKFQILVRKKDQQPVEMFPDCVTAPDPFRPELGCYIRPKSQE